MKLRKEAYKMLWKMIGRDTLRIPVPCGVGKVLATIALFFIVIACLLAIHLADVVSGDEENRVERVQALKGLQWEAVNSAIIDNYDKAGLTADTVKDDLERRLTSSEITAYDIKSEILEQPAGNPVYTAMLSAIQNKYTNDVHTDINSVFIASHDGVLADYSMLKMGEVPDRKWESEIRSRGSTSMAKEAAEAIINQSPVFIFWNTKSCYIDQNLKSAPMTLDTIKEDFMANGPRALYGYIFLKPSYLRNTEDVFGTPDINNKGVRQPNYKIIVVSSFNLGDAIKAKHPELLTSYDHEINLINSISRQDQQNQRTIHYIMIVVSLGFAFATVLLNNHVSELFKMAATNKTKNDESRGDKTKNE